MTLLSVGYEPPPFYCPIPPAVHPEVEDIERRAVEWIDRVRVHESERERARIVGTNSAEFYARFAPDGPADDVLVAVLWVYWGFAFDDARCDRGPFSADPPTFLAMAGQLQRALEGAMDGSPPPADRYAAALHDIVTRMRERAAPVPVRRFADAHRYWLYCVAWQIGNRSVGRVPTVDEYLTMRLGSAGGPPTLALLEIANGMEVPGHEMERTAVRALTDMARLIASLDNDLLSYVKELRDTQADQNIVGVIAHHERITVEQAALRAVSARDRIMTRFLRVRERARRGASRELDRYLDGLGHGIRGNIDWSARVPRYATDEPVPVAFTDRPLDAGPVPVEAPGISWWWELEG